MTKIKFDSPLRRVTALLLALALCVGFLPVRARADTTLDDTSLIPVDGNLVTSATWTTEDTNPWSLSNGTATSANVARASTDVPGTSVLTLSNIPYEMNGWRIQAYFTGNGGPLYTAGAYITVLQAGGVPGGSDSPGGGSDSIETACVNLAKQAYSDVYYQAAAAGFTASSITNYSYLNGKSDFNITLSNARWRIVGEFSSWYQATDSYGYGPVHAVVNDLSGNMQRSDHLEGNGMDAFYGIMQYYQ